MKHSSSYNYRDQRIQYFPSMRSRFSFCDQRLYDHQAASKTASKTASNKTASNKTASNKTALIRQPLSVLLIKDLGVRRCENIVDGIVDDIVDDIVDIIC